MLRFRRDSGNIPSVPEFPLCGPRARWHEVQKLVTRNKEIPTQAKRGLEWATCQSLAASPRGTASLRSALTVAQSVPARAPTTGPGRREAPYRPGCPERREGRQGRAKRPRVGGDSR